MIISGRRVRGGGIPTGIFVEIYGPESSGKTALLCEIGGNVQKINGTVRYLDPEGRIDNQYAQMFGISLDESNCSQPDTCLLYTSDAADDLLCVELGGRRNIKKKKHLFTFQPTPTNSTQTFGTTPSLLHTYTYRPVTLSHTYT